MSRVARLMCDQPRAAIVFPPPAWLDCRTGSTARRTTPDSRRTAPDYVGDIQSADRRMGAWSERGEPSGSVDPELPPVLGQILRDLIPRFWSVSILELADPIAGEVCDLLHLDHRVGNARRAVHDPSPD